MTKSLVAIRCLTYNHEPYIRDALEGFVMQKTNFPFVAIVHDDASTDGTAAIIREYAEKYPDIIKPIYETENQYSKRDGSLGRIMNKACEETGAKYIAMCEGDDYWTDPLKLQKQVDFLESHPEYGMCYTKAKRYNQEKKRFIDTWGGPNETFEKLLTSNTIPTPTVVLRHDIQVKYYDEIKPSKQNWLMGDYPMWLYFSRNYKIKFLDKEFAVYRMLIFSASHNDNIIQRLKFNLSFFKISKFFAGKYNSPQFQKISDVVIWLEFQRNKLNRNITMGSTISSLHSTHYIKYKIFILVLSLIPYTLAEIIIRNTK